MINEVEETPRAPADDEWDFSLATSDQFEDLPLHPVVSMGMKRLSSHYFSLNGSEASTSVADLFSLLDDNNDDDDDEVSDGLDLLYHDILMHVFTFLDASTLRQFSQTARRPNFECFYFLQLQLQRAMLPPPPASSSSSEEKTSSDFLLAGSGCLSRLAEREETAANLILINYLNSNSTLKTMPLSHSLAYLRHVLARHGFQQHTRSRPTLTSAAVLITTMVGVSFMELDASTLFQVGLAIPVLASTAKKIQEQRIHNQTSPRTTMKSLPSQMWQQLQQMREEPRASLAKRFYAAFHHHQAENEQDNQEQQHEEKSSKDEETQKSPNPYIHEEELKLPSGCVGAYSRAVHDASSQLRELIREERKRNYLALGEEERLDVSTQFLQACTSDDCLKIVQDMVRCRKVIDVDGFYVGPDGVETCALHTAAFHGACRILEFLVSGIDEHLPEQDGGLANVNILDANNWTAMHFCAGANSMEAVRILANHGALLAQEADNGYTPFHWAERLSNQDVAAELQRLGADQRFLANGPLSAIASRFFAMMPSHT